MLNCLCFLLPQFADVEAQFADDDADPNAAGYHRLRDDVTLPTISDTMSDVLLPPPSELFDADSSRQASTSGRDVTPSTAAAPPTQAATVDTKDVTLGFSSISSGLGSHLNLYALWIFCRTNRKNISWLICLQILEYNVITK